MTTPIVPVAALTKVLAGEPPDARHQVSPVDGELPSLNKVATSEPVADETIDDDADPVKRAKKATIEVVMSKLKRTAPKNFEFDISRSTKNIFTRVKYVIRTGIEPVDTLTGGIPFGRTTEIYGLEGCLKTALMINICGAAGEKNIFEVESWEKEGKFTKLKSEEVEVTILYIDNETSLEDNDRLIVNGKKVDMLISDADTIDMIFKQIETTIDALEEVEAASKLIHDKSVEENKKSVAANKKNKALPIKPIVPLVKQFLVVIVDTIAATASHQEMSEEWGKQDFPRHAQQIKKGFKRLNRRVNARNVALICANQVGDSFAPKAKTGGGRFQLPQESDFSTPGGKALKYFASLRIFMVNANPNYKVFQKSKFPDGQVTQLYTTKNRQLKPRRTARLALLYRTGLSNEYSILEHMIHFKMATWKDSGSIAFNFSKFGIKPQLSLQDEDLKEDEFEVEIAHKQFWPETYAKYKPEFDQLWEKARQIMFETDTSDFVGADDDEEDDVSAILSGDS